MHHVDYFVLCDHYILVNQINFKDKNIFTGTGAASDAESGATSGGPSVGIAPGPFDVDTGVLRDRLEILLKSI